MVGNTTYLNSTTDYSIWDGCYKMTYISPDSGFLDQSLYIPDYPDGITGYDIGYQLSTGYIWMAVDNDTSPVICCNPPGGSTVSYIPASIGIGSDIHGVAFEGSSSQYIWVSNQTTDKLHRVDLVGSAIEEQGTYPAPCVSISCTQNPFFNSTVVNLTGFTGTTSVNIFDIRGRKVFSKVTGNSTLFNGELLPPGTYLIFAADELGNTATLRVVKL